MASIRPHPAGGWRVYIKKLGVRETKVFETKAAASNWAAAREAEIVAARSSAGPTEHARSRTVHDALTRYAREVSPGKKGARWELVRIEAFKDRLPFVHRRMAEVTAADVAAWRDARLQQVQSASARREWSLLSSIWALAQREWKWVSSNPWKEASRPAAGRERTRRVRPQEVRAIVRALGYRTGRAPRTKSQATALAFLVSLRTALRSGEILALSAGDIDLERRVLRVQEAKNGEGRTVPLSRAARRLLRPVAALPRPFPVEPGTRDALFRKAAAACGIEDLHFHDARAEALTRMARKVDVMTLAKISGHRDVRMLLNVYYRPDIAEMADRL